MAAARESLTQLRPQTARELFAINLRYVREGTKSRAAVSPLRDGPVLTGEGCQKSSLLYDLPALSLPTGYPGPLQRDRILNVMQIACKFFKCHAV